MDDELAPSSVDYLGRSVPVSLANKSALPVGGVPAGAAAGPVVPSTVVGDGGPGASGAGASIMVPGGVTSAPPWLSLLLKGGNLARLASDVLFQPEGAVGQGRTESAWQEFMRGEKDLSPADSGGGSDVFGAGVGPSLFEGFDSTPIDAFGAGVDVGGAAAEAGAGLATDVATEAAVEGATTSVGGGPIFAMMKMAVDLLGEGKWPLQELWDPPSKDWLSFPGRARDTMSNIEGANRALAQALATGDDPKAFQAALTTWRDTIGQSVGGFGKGADPWAISDVPGLTGREHTARGDDWRSRAVPEGSPMDLSPEVFGLRAELEAARAGKSSAERLTAFRQAAENRLASLTSEHDVQAKMLREQEERWLAEWSARDDRSGGGP